MNKWLDLKDNPLNPGLKIAAGDCLDETQCKKCAISVIKYIKQQANEEEREKQIQLKLKRGMNFINFYFAKIKKKKFFKNNFY